MFLLRIAKPLADHVHIRCRRLCSALCFFLKTVEDEHARRQPDRVDCAIGIAVMPVDDFQHSPASKPFQCLCTRMLLPKLGEMEREANGLLYIVRK